MGTYLLPATMKLGYFYEQSESLEFLTGVQATGFTTERWTWTPLSKGKLDIAWRLRCCS